MNILISDSFIKENINNLNKLLAYIGIRTVMKNGINKYHIVTKTLAYNIIGSVDNKYINLSISNGLKEFNIEKCGHDFILDASNIHIVNEYYSALNIDYIQKILSLDNKEKYNILRLYCYICTTIFKSGDNKGIGFSSYIDISENMDLCRQTISKYMDILADNNIIYIYHSNDYIKINGEIKCISNTYGDAKIRNKIIEVGNRYNKNYGKREEDNRKIEMKKNSTKTRSASAKYNIILKMIKDKQEVKYSYDEMKEIYTTLLNYNSRYSYNKKLQKDLSIFKEYDFYKGEK